MRMEAVSCAFMHGGAAAGGETDLVSAHDSVGPGHRRVDLDERFGRGIHERGDPSGLSTRLILRHHAARGQEKWEFVVGLLGGGLEGDRVEARPAVFGGKPLQKETRRARMFFAGTGPEYAILLADAVPGDSGIIGYAAGRCAPQFVEDFRGLRGEKSTVPEPRRQCGKTLRRRCAPLPGVRWRAA